MKKEILYNKKNRLDLEKELKNETFSRVTCSFYRYILIEKPELARDQLYRDWSDLKIFGRIYIANEGINAQLSCPEKNWDLFIKTMSSSDYLKDVSLKKAIQDGASFYKLVIKIKDEIVNYNIGKDEFDMNQVGKHLTPKEFNDKLEENNTLVVDMRNYYESEVGRFENAIIPDVDTSRELLPEVKNLLNGHEKDEILLYCTGGIRCEKASSYLIKSGFSNVNQLKGGIIQYAHDVRTKGLDSKFKGKNFVFDARMGERITNDIVGKCHQCGNPADHHLDCGNEACHILFIQCDKCYKKYDGCCTKECKDFASLPIEEQRILRKDPKKVVSQTRYSSRVKPKLARLN